MFVSWKKKYKFNFEHRGSYYYYFLNDRQAIRASLECGDNVTAITCVFPDKGRKVPLSQPHIKYTELVVLANRYMEGMDKQPKNAILSLLSYCKQAPLGLVPFHSLERMKNYDEWSESSVGADFVDFIIDNSIECNC